MRIFLVSILLICGIVLQMFLSKKDNKWLGLILPILAFLFAAILALGTKVPADGINAQYLMQFVGVLLIGNIPTIIFLIIYYFYRRKKRAAN